MSRFPYENIRMQSMQSMQSNTPQFSQRVNIYSWQGQQNEASQAQKNMPSTTVQQQNGDFQDQYPEKSFGDQSASWQPGFWRRFPFLSICSLLAVAFCIVAALYVLITSDGKPIDKWGYGIAPAVYLAIISVATNVLLSLALVNGLVISFWRTALRGCTLNEINRNWHNGNSALSALTTGFRKGGRITALACLFTIVGLLRGPLNQKASNVRPNNIYKTQGYVKLDVAQTLPDGYTGMNTMSRAHNMDTSRLTPVFGSIMQDYSSRSDMKLEHTGCGDYCKTTVKGFGFDTNCTTTDYKTRIQGTAAFNADTFVTSTTISQIGNTTLENGYTWADTGIAINVTSYINQGPMDKNNTSTFNFRSHICLLTPGTTSYDIELRNDTVTLLDDSSSDFFEAIELPSPVETGGMTTIGGFQYAMSYLFDSKATVQWHGAVSAVSLQGALANEMLVDNGNNTGGVWYTYNDPMDLLLSSIREIAFRTSLRAGADNTTITDAAQTVAYAGQSSHTIYVTNKKYMIIAAAVSLLSLLAVASTFYGWWELGREMSMSPLEIAKAFDAPLLRGVGSNMPFGKMEQSVLATQVQYGENPRNGLPWNGPAGDQRGKVGTLKFGEYSRKPQQGQLFSA